MNIKRYVISLCMSFIVLIVSAVNIVPHPMEYDVNPYVRFYLDESTSIVVKDKELYAVADVVANTLRRSTGYKFPILKRGRNSIVLRCFLWVTIFTTIITAGNRIFKTN